MSERIDGGVGSGNVGAGDGFEEDGTSMISVIVLRIAIVPYRLAR